MGHTVVSDTPSSCSSATGTTVNPHCRIQLTFSYSKIRICVQMINMTLNVNSAQCIKATIMFCILNYSVLALLGSIHTNCCNNRNFYSLSNFASWQPVVFIFFSFFSLKLIDVRHYSIATKQIFSSNHGVNVITPICGNFKSSPFNYRLNAHK